jgi:hypothetical protein
MQAPEASLRITADKSQTQSQKNKEEQSNWPNL